MAIVNHHKKTKAKNIIIDGTIIDGQTYTFPLILPNLEGDHPAATIHNSLELARKKDARFVQLVENLTDEAVKLYKKHKLDELDEEMELLPDAYQKYKADIKKLVETNVPIKAIRTRTEKMIWHQRMAHPCDEYLYNAHKSIDGVPKFDRVTSVLDECPVCIQAKQTKEPAGNKTTKVATVPYQGLSIDFSFSGIRSKNENRRVDYEGFNGETCYILVTDHMTGMLHGDTRTSKAPPKEWLKRFLAKYSPKSELKYVYLDQGGELYSSPDIINLLTEYGYEILPTGADNSRQNGPVERAHRTLGNAIRTLLLGAGLDMRFWPYAFYHGMRIQNALPSKGMMKSPIELATQRRENFSNLRTFGCRVWVRPPRGRRAKYRPNSKKGIFLGYMPHTTRNMMWHDPETNRIKIATHARFDEGMNDLDINSIPPNVQQLQRSDDGVRPEKDPKEITVDELEFFVTPFPETVTKQITVKDKQKIGIEVASDPLSKRAFLSDVKPKSPASQIYSTLRATKNKLQGAYFIAINGDPVFTAQDVNRKLRELRDQGVENFTIEFAPAERLNTKQLKRAMNEFGLLHPKTKPTNGKEKDEDKDIHLREANSGKGIPHDKALNTRVAKRFEGTLHFGTIDEIWYEYKEGEKTGKDPKRKRWHVTYDDDDGFEEEFTDTLLGAFERVQKEQSGNAKK